MSDLIRRALRHDGFRLFAQPVVPLADGLSGMHAEVLLRLDNGAGQLILPGEFLPLARQHQLAPAVDNWVVEHGLAWLLQHRGALPIEMLTINLCGASVSDPDFRGHLLHQFDALPTSLREVLGLEIGEADLLAAPADAASLIDALALRGIRVALDDFSGKPLALRLLERIRFDLIKIDGAQIAALNEDAGVDAVVRHCVSLAQGMGAHTVAEGVETSAVLERVRRAGIDYAQGQLLAPPASIDELSPQRMRPARYSRRRGA